MVKTSITLEELHLFHKVDREMFSRLVIELGRDPVESLLVMAVWLWLESKKGYPRIIVKIMGVSNVIVNAAADEAVLCLKCLETSTPGEELSGGIPLTVRIMESETFSLETIRCNRLVAVNEIKYVLNNVCARIFTDILLRVLGGTCFGFLHPVFGDVNIVTPPSDNDIPRGESTWGWEEKVLEEERTLFLTFSRGFPMFGDKCVEKVVMGNASSYEQPLYAKLVVNSVAMVDHILNGMRVSKFMINGKQIWARKYEIQSQQNL
ncbi:hypothetical protein UlMin_035545 [Ulmus minor]